jgi:PD-(D/E)XK nuclease superfamily
VAKASHGRCRARNQESARAEPRTALRDNSRIWTFAPSDFAFLWDECHRCFYRKVVLGQARPRAPFPKVFGAIDRAMKEFYVGRRSELIARGAPAGVIGDGNWTRSIPLSAPGTSSSFIVRGRTDVLVHRDDATTVVVDFKTAEPKAEHVPTYSRQLHAYALALENPASGPAVSVSSLGLLCFSPGSFEAERSRARLNGNLRWIEVSRDDEAFERFIADVISVLEDPKPPAVSRRCAWCKGRENSWAA